MAANTQGARERLAKALGHPLRIRILSSLVGTEASASALSSQFGDVSVPDVAYHLRVLFRDCDLIELVGTHRGPGSEEKFYRLKSDATQGRLVLPLTIQRGLRKDSVQTFVDTLVAALDGGAFDPGEKTTLRSKRLVVDDKAMSEINHILHGAMVLIERAAGRAKSRRMKRKDRSRAVREGKVYGAAVGLVAFHSQTHETQPAHAG